VSWRVFLTDSSQPDLEPLSEAEQGALVDELFGWVEAGPPRTNRRVVGGVELFEERLESGFVVTYFVDEGEPYVAVVRVRRV
jgi:mRNA-degrading endonuclease RelE of RelBE toxin-antitoxin system